MKPNHGLLLGVNIDHAATLRQARYRAADRTCGSFVEPDPVLIALKAEEAGADGITVHLREDRRHIQEEDVHRLRAAIRTRLNLEMACTDEMLAFALELKPEAICLVPENRAEVTTEGGLDVAGQRDRIQKIVTAATEAGIEVSCFIDPDRDQIDASADIGAPVVELHTGAFAHAWHDEKGARMEQMHQLQEAALHADQRGLRVNAGHGINYQNIRGIRVIPCLHELNIGHSLLSRALSTGIDEAVREMKTAMLA
jgi:pyridoxine 5-phosphate synthase